jgi:hypothetical protein
MLAYEVPTCCGANLTLFADVNLAARVASNGKPSMRTPQIFSFAPKWLFCIRCKASYEASLDDKGRAVKGEKR